MMRTLPFLGGFIHGTLTGLPCRGGCDIVFHPTGGSLPEIQAAARVRDAHEVVIHDHHHVPADNGSHHGGIYQRHNRR